MLDEQELEVMKLEVFNGSLLIDAQRRLLALSEELEEKVKPEIDVTVENAEDFAAAILKRIDHIEAEVFRKKNFVRQLVEEKVDPFLSLIC
jgi:hypothetical protein